MRILLHIVITAIAVWVATLVPGVEVGGGNLGTRALTLAGVAVIFGIVNAVLKPIAKTLGCVLYVLTLGLFGLVVNGLLFWLTSSLAGALALPFHVSGFWAAVFGAIIVSIVSGLLHGLLRRTELE